jgi:hypothetical protein
MISSINTYAVAARKITDCCLASAITIGARLRSKNTVDATAAVKRDIQETESEG